MLATQALVALLPFLLLRLAVPAGSEATCSGIVPMRGRTEWLSITQFGGVGDGRTLNTWPFRKAVYRIQHLRRRGGSLLYVPPGVWLTGPFNLTSHMTLYLARGATIKATQETWNWPLIDPLPSYGRGRELPGGRYMSLIQGNHLRDVIITGNRGIIDGQGEVWWNMWRRKSLRFTRPHLVEFMHSINIIISNVVFQNSPFWNIHPVYCSNVVIRYIAVLAPYNSPNTDGIDPDSSSYVCIEDCYISTGDDLIAIKSGWDEYGIAYARPSTSITIRRITGSTPFAGIAIGSEVSGGVSNIRVHSLNLYNTGIGVHIKTNTGRGGYIRNVTIAGLIMHNVRKGVSIEGNVGDHPDSWFDRRAVPMVDGVMIRDVWGVGVKEAGSIVGIPSSPFTRVCMVNVRMFGGGSGGWRCENVRGAAVGVSPWPCAQLMSRVEAGYCSNAY